MAQKSTSKCSLCGVNNGIYFCYECRKALCRSCRTPHDNIPASKHHTVKDLTSVDLTSFKSVSNCKAHNTDFSFYCTQCEVMICGKCVTTIHKGHNFSDFEEIAYEMRKEAEIRLEQMKKKLSKSSVIISNIEKNDLLKIENQAKCISKKIKLTIQEVHQVIDSISDVKITEVEDFETLGKEQLKRNLVNRKQIHFRCSNLHSTLQQLLLEKHALTFLNAYQNLKGDFMEFQDLELGPTEIERPPHFEKKLLVGELTQTLTTQYELRPKICYIFCELYDNEWTDAFEELCHAGDEKSSSIILRHILEKSYDFAKANTEKYTNGLESAFLAINDSIEITPAISKCIKEQRQSTAFVLGDSLFKSFLSSHTEFNVGGKDVQVFIKKTLSLCWLMTIQDPPVIISTGLSGKFNTDFFRYFTKSGSNVDYVVWPAVFLHEGGPIMCKGVAQGK